MEPSSVLVEGAEKYCRIFGFTDTGNRWLDGEAPPSDVPWVDALIGHTSFAISRQNEAAYPSTVVFEADKKVSRPHAEVTYSAIDGSWTIKCLGKNGLDIDAEHIGQDGTKRLTSKARIRCGDSYFFVLFPKKADSAALPPPAPRSSLQSVRSAPKGKVLVPYETMITKVGRRLTDFPETLWLSTTAASFLRSTRSTISNTVTASRRTSRA
jgi:hypothetical protein